MISDNGALDVVLFLIILLPSVIFHEVEHGWVAERFGDPTARAAGRITLNPVPHIDPLGSVILPTLLALSGSNVFGWAKPVPVNPRFFRRPTQQMAVVALAGPATNLALAAVVALAARFDTIVSPVCGSLGFAANGLCLGANQGIIADGLWPRFVVALVLVNVALAIFNMLPIPPLDGSKLVPLVLSEQGRITFARVSQYGFLIIFALLFIVPQSLSFMGSAIGWLMRLVIP